MVDNTFLSPGWQRPLATGADLVLHSTTKYLNGHSDVVGGAVVAATRQLHERLAWWANCLGLTGAPFDSFLTLRGMRTLARAPRGARPRTPRALADWLDAPAGGRAGSTIRDSPRTRAMRSRERQQSGFGAMVSSSCTAARRRCSASSTGLEYFTLAESLGGVESLVAHPAHHDACGDGRVRAPRARASPTACCACRSASRAWRTCAPISRAALARAGAPPRASRRRERPQARRRSASTASPAVAGRRGAAAGAGDIGRAQARRRARGSTASSSARGFGLEAERMAQQHRGAQDRARRGWRCRLPGDVGRGAVDRLVQAAARRRPSEAEGSMPSEPASIEASSVRMSPNMFSVTITSKSARLADQVHRGRVDQHVFEAHVRETPPAASASTTSRHRREVSSTLALSIEVELAAALSARARAARRTTRSISTTV